MKAGQTMEKKSKSELESDGELIDEAVKLFGSQRAVAERMGVTEGAVSRWRQSGISWRRRDLAELVERAKHPTEPAMEGLDRLTDAQTKVNTLFSRTRGSGEKWRLLEIILDGLAQAEARDEKRQA